MKKISVILAGLFLLFVSGAIAEERTAPVSGDKMTLLKIEDSEISDTENAVVSSEQTEAGIPHTLKYALTAGKKGFSLISTDSVFLKGKKGDWTGYDTLNIKYVLEGDKPLESLLFIGDHQSTRKWKYGNYCTKPVKFEPGKHKITIKISELVCDQGKPIDLENMRALTIEGTELLQNYTLYILKIWVEKE